MKNKFLGLSFAVALVLSSFGSVQAQSNSHAGERLSNKSIAFFPIEDIKPGMRGVSRTVFSGSEPEEFQVEILGVLPGFIGPKQPAIIGRLSGKNAERTGVFAGMSGSPVFIDGKLVGAISFSFPFSKEPIAGITPIQTMIDIFEQSAPKAESSGEPRSFSFKELASVDWQANLPKPAMSGAPFLANVGQNSPLVSLLGQQFAPIATPLVFSGIRQDTLNLYASQLAASGLLPVASAGGSSEITPMKKADDKTLQPGDSVTIALARGDYSLAAAGTVTFRDGEKIYAFGHQFLNLGSANMPMSEGSVIAVVPNTNNSFKLSVPGDLVGNMSQDRQTGIYGKLGEQAKMIPVELTVQTSRNKSETYKYEVVSDSFLTPLLLNITVFNAITATERSLGESTINVRGQIDVKDAPAIRLERRISASNAPVFAAGSIAVPTAALLGSGFDDAEIKNIKINITATDGKKAGSLERLALNRSEVKAGESFEAQAFVRTEAGKQFVQRIPVQLPADTAPGTYLVYVGDGGSLQQVAASRSFVPKTVSELVSVINQVKKTDRLYLQVSRVTQGEIIGTKEMPNLPPSMLATLNNDRSVGGVTPTVLSPIYEKELDPAEFVIVGQQVLTIEVTR
ncbi:MAG TPA: SpoIVB peptidase S55 domain-containing protein [Pyrinomonadaceae bacterium]|nr:SpoIVB peptidase S55 domain-containing protein [Pyrinomonadaceae bacterium]